VRHIRPQKLLIILALLLPVVALFSLVSGAVNLPLASVGRGFVAWFSGDGLVTQDSIILFNIRLPRIVLAMTVGAVLGSSGAVMQRLFRNPLADPSLIGVCSGACVGASLVIVAASAMLQSTTVFGLTLVALGAFAGGFVATILVYRLATSNMGTSVATMLLAGIAISALAGAINSLLSYFADNDMLRQISLWQMGNLSTANWPRVALIALVATILAVAGGLVAAIAALPWIVQRLV